jgi:hypothetical protein
MLFGIHAWTKKVASCSAFCVVGLSRWVLDAPGHLPELPLVGSQSQKLGSGLWQSMWFALILEGLSEIFFFLG